MNGGTVKKVILRVFSGSGPSAMHGWLMWTAVMVVVTCLVTCKAKVQLLNSK